MKEVIRFVADETNVANYRISAEYLEGDLPVRLGLAKRLPGLSHSHPCGCRSMAVYCPAITLIR